MYELEYLSTGKGVSAMDLVEARKIEYIKITGKAYVPCGAWMHTQCCVLFLIKKY